MNERTTIERDIDFVDPLLQRKYEKALEQKGPAWRVTRSLTLLSEFCQMLAHMIAKEEPNISERELRRRVALRLYQGDKLTVQRLDKMT